MKSPARPEDVLKLRFPMAAALSPEGSRLALSLSATNTAVPADGTSLWLMNLTTEEMSQIDLSAVWLSAPVWSPDGDALAVVALVSGVPQVCVISVREQPATLRPVTTLPMGVGMVAPDWSPDGTQLTFSAPVKPPRNPSEPYRVTQPIWRLDGIGLIDDLRQEIHLVDLETCLVRQVTSHGGVNAAVSFSLDGARLLYTAFDTDDRRQRFVVRSVDLTGRDQRTYYDEQFYVFPPAAAWLADGSVVLTTLNSGGLERMSLLIERPDGRRDVCPLPSDGWLFGMVQGDFPFFNLQSPRIVVRPGGRDAFVHVQHGGKINVYRTPLVEPGDWQLVVDDDAVSVPVGATADFLVYARTTMTDPPDFWTLDLRDGTRRRRTTLNSGMPFLGSYEIHPLTVQSADGTPVESWYLKSADAAGPLPTVVSLHGGPSVASWGHAYSFDHLLLADAGYGVLLPNTRGSSGYTAEFVTANHGRWGQVELADLMAAVDEAVTAGLADPNRLAVFGISAGAFLAGWAVTHTDRFACAVLDSPALDWAAMIGSDIGPLFMPWIGAVYGSGEAAAGVYARSSVTTYAANCRTPVLLIQNEADQRTPASQSDQLYAALHIHGCVTEMLRVPNTPHAASIGFGHPHARTAQNEALLDWVCRYLPHHETTGGATIRNNASNA